jgi:rubrerythrin
MSDEELAELLEEMTYDSMEHRAEYWLKWLKQPAEGE